MSVQVRDLVPLLALCWYMVFFDISTKSGVQGQQCPLYPGTLEPVSYSLEGALKDSSNHTVRQVPFVCPQLVGKIGSFYKTGLS